MEPEGIKKASTIDVFINQTVRAKTSRILKVRLTALNCGYVPLILTSSGKTSGTAALKGICGGSGDTPGEVNTVRLKWWIAP
jgi:hypothetical protein